jgi:hypothetical protein
VSNRCTSMNRCRALKFSLLCYGRALQCAALPVFAFAALCASALCVHAQPPAKAPDLEASTPQSWVETGATNEVRIIENAGNFPLRYRTRKVDAKGDALRDVIEAREGTVARIIERDGRSLTPEEDAAERARLTGLMDTPGDIARHKKRENSNRVYLLELIRAFPHAMLFTYVPGQPQRPDSAAPQVVIDFKPDPQYKSTGMVTGVLAGLEGRLWIGRDSHCLNRIEVRIVKPVDLGWGMLARIYPGGTAEFEQVDAGGDRWTFSHVRQNVTIREMLIKTMQEHMSVDAADFQVLPAPISYKDAIRTLLATPLPTH